MRSPLIRLASSGGDARIGPRLLVTRSGKWTPSNHWGVRESAAQPFCAVRRVHQGQGYEASLEKGKLYRVIPDQNAEAHGYLRIVDERGDDYGYAADRFFGIDLPKPLEKALLQIAS